MTIKRVMVAGLSPNRQYLRSIMSFRDLKLREGLDGLWVQYGTRGDVGRTIVEERFTNDKRFDALLLLDLDQIFPDDTLLRLIEHDLPMVSGHYMMRTTTLLRSIWQYTVDGGWPFLPYIWPNIPRTGLHRLASTGMGCLLIKREVIEAVQNYLPAGSSAFEIGKVPEISPMMGNFGSDYRFLYYAQKLGYELWGDADVDCPHYSSILLDRDTPDHFKFDPIKAAEHLDADVFENTIRSKGKMTLNAVIARIEAIKGIIPTLTDNDQVRMAHGQLFEMELWKEKLETLSPPPHAIQAWQEKKSATPLPVFRSEDEVNDAIENRGGLDFDMSAEEVAAKRGEVRSNEAMNAAKIMNGRYQQITSRERGELDEIK